jgi:Delta3-Delta2-enoyl-CoA isomerase
MRCRPRSRRWGRTTQCAALCWCVQQSPEAQQRRGRREWRRGSRVQASANPKLFSAGLDLSSLVPYPGDSAMDAFASALHAAFYDVYMFPKPLTVALNGHSPAGGTVFALGADIRLAASDAPEARMGLNEAMLGFPAPSFVAQAYERVIGQRRAELALVQGAMVSFQTAHQWGLVDQLVPNASLLDAAVAACKELTAVPVRSFGASKQILRAPVVLEIATDAARADSRAVFKQWLSSKHVQDRLMQYIASVRAKK